MSGQNSTFAAIALWKIEHLAMETIILRPENELLKKYVEYFLFLKKSDNNLVNYTTFPNSNLCVAIYKENKVTYLNDGKNNICSIAVGENRFSSRIYGFHTRPFTVDLHCELDQVCIIFRAAALGVFTVEDLDGVGASDRAVEDFLQLKDRFLLEQVFEERHPALRARLLENALVAKLNDRIPARLLEVLAHIKLSSALGQDTNVALLCRKFGISDTTLYRLFRGHVGQSPQRFIKTVRFRRALPVVLDNESPLTQIGMENNYYDQAHFIKDFRAFSGMAPKKLQKKASLAQDRLAWIFEETVV